MAERTVDQIQREIEAARVSLAQTVDQLAYRGNPRRLSERAKAALARELGTPRGKAALGVGVLLVLVLIRKIVKR